MKIVAVLYPGGAAAAETPELLGCAENALGLREWLEGAGHELVALTDAGAGLDSHLPTADASSLPRFGRHTSAASASRRLPTSSCCSLPG